MLVKEIVGSNIHNNAIFVENASIPIMLEDGPLEKPSIGFDIQICEED